MEESNIFLLQIPSTMGGLILAKQETNLKSELLIKNFFSK